MCDSPGSSGGKGYIFLLFLGGGGGPPSPLQEVLSFTRKGDDLMVRAVSAAGSLVASLVSWNPA